MKVSLNDILPAALAHQYAVACFNVFGYEDAVAVIRAAEQDEAPVIVATNKEMTEFMGPVQAASMLGHLADEASVPVCIHLDHCYEVETVKQAVDAGYTSVMFDGSQLPLSENIEKTSEVCLYAQRHNVSVEAEIGSVPYSTGRDHIKSELTDPSQAERLALESGADAIAISVGNVHRLQEATSKISFDRVKQIGSLVNLPLVIHGTSGINDSDVQRLSAMSVCKFNIGTTLRMAFGQSLRHCLVKRPDEFDRLTLFNQVMPAMQAEASRNIRLLGAQGKAKDYSG